MNVLENEQPIWSDENVQSHGGAIPHENHPSALLPMMFTWGFDFKLELESSGEWMLYKKALRKDDWLKITADAGVATEYRFHHRFPLPGGELAPSYFKLELDSSGKWTLYKKGHRENHWLKMTADLVAAAERNRERCGRLAAMLSKWRRADD